MTTYAVETRVARIGIVLALYPTDPRLEMEIQRAPDSAGSPDTGSAEIIVLVDAGTKTYTDLISGGTWHYRIRHVRAGATESSWTEWVSASPKQIPAELPQIPEVGGWVIKQGKLESTDGNIILDAPNEQIRIGATAFLSGVAGIWMGEDGASGFDFRAGDPSGNYVAFDESAGTLVVVGTITIGSGSSGVANLSDAGALAQADDADWSTQVTGTGKPADDADVTASNAQNLSWLIATGLISAGNLDIDAANEQIRIGSDVTDPTTGTGIFIGLDGTNPDKYDLRVGDPNGQQVWWDHSEGKLKYTGILEANGIRYGPLHVDATDRPTSGSGTTNMETFAIPAGAMGATGGVHVRFLVNIAGTTNTKAVALVIGGSAIVNLIFGSSFEGRVSFDVHTFNTTTTTQRTHIAATVDGADGIVDVASSSADTTAAVDYEIDGFVTNAADTVTLEVSAADLLAPGA